MYQYSCIPSAPAAAVGCARANAGARTSACVPCAAGASYYDSSKLAQRTP